MPEETIFHKIIKGEIPCHKVWEDDNHLAFLSIFPNTDGVTVVIPKKYEPSYFAEVADESLAALMVASKKVAKILEERLPDVGRVGLIFEGLGVNYLHAKLFPMHGVGSEGRYQNTEQKQMVFYNKYPGYLSSHDAALADSNFLSALAAYLRGENENYPKK